MKKISQWRAKHRAALSGTTIPGVTSTNPVGLASKAQAHRFRMFASEAEAAAKAADDQSTKQTRLRAAAAWLELAGAAERGDLPKVSAGRLQY